jgi:hypothetical protein
MEGERMQRAVVAYREWRAALLAEERAAKQRMAAATWLADSVAALTADEQKKLAAYVAATERS